MSYAVIWQQAGQPSVTGRLEFVDGWIVLSGRPLGGSPTRCSVALDEVADVHLERSRDAQGGRGRRLLVVGGTNGTRIEVASLEGPGALHELADELTTRRV